jgi:hypothetical protein
MSLKRGANVELDRDTKHDKRQTKKGFKATLAKRFPD